MINREFADKQKKNDNWTPQITADDIANSVMKYGNQVAAFAGIFVLKNGEYFVGKSKSKGISDFVMIGALDQLKHDLL